MHVTAHRNFSVITFLYPIPNSNLWKTFHSYEYLLKYLSITYTNKPDWIQLAEAVVDEAEVLFIGKSDGGGTSSGDKVPAEQA